MKELEVCPSVSCTTFISTPAAGISEAAAVVEIVEADGWRDPPWRASLGAESRHRKYRQVVDRWHVDFADLTGGHGLLGQVEGRVSTVVAAWLTAQPTTWRGAITHMAIDMCAIFRSAIRAALPHARIVVDHFHLVQLVKARLAELRRRLTWKMRGRRGRKGDPEYDHRRLLRAAAEELTDQRRTVLERDLTRIGTYGRHILAGWHAKEKLRDLLALARTHPARSQISHRLHAFYAWCADHAYLPELVTLAATVEAWQSEIEAFLSHRDHQRQEGGDQPSHQARSPRRVRLSQPCQPTPLVTLRNHARQQKPSHPCSISKTSNVWPSTD
ncbi:transposase [Nonomuraea angiospora]|uniref:transposase n=1 Tax=Nonomuraea angiospora TaxID=46172 RepID=UPI0037A1741A